MISIIVHIIKGICHIGLGVLCFNLYKKKNNIAFLLAGFAFFLQIYEILSLDTILPNFISDAVSLLQGISVISAIVLFFKSHKKNELFK